MLLIRLTCEPATTRLKFRVKAIKYTEVRFIHEVGVFMLQKYDRILYRCVQETVTQTAERDTVERNVTKVGVILTRTK